MKSLCFGNIFHSSYKRCLWRIINVSRIIINYKKVCHWNQIIGISVSEIKAISSFHAVHINYQRPQHLETPKSEEPIESKKNKDEYCISHTFQWDSLKQYLSFSIVLFSLWFWNCIAFYVFMLLLESQNWLLYDWIDSFLVLCDVDPYLW